MQKWEYQTVENKVILSNQLLNEFGKYRWELVNFIQELEGMGRLVPGQYVYIFKRLIEE
jgi:hypothetical protein